MWAQTGMPACTMACTTGANFRSALQLHRVAARLLDLAHGVANRFL
jgi:hypothetical protein